MHDRLEVGPRGAVAKTMRASGAIEGAVRPHQVPAEALDDGGQPGEPGATASRASWSASIAGTPSAANRPRQYDLPVAMPPVSAACSTSVCLDARAGAAAATVFFRSIAIVSGPTPPGPASAPRHFRHLGCTSPTTTDPRRSKSGDPWRVLAEKRGRFGARR